MKDSGSKQKADLRVVLEKDGHYGLYWHAYLKGYDLYFGHPPIFKDELFPQDQDAPTHEHIHIRHLHKKGYPNVLNTKLKGTIKIEERSSFVLHDVPWNYRLIEDTDVRKSLVINLGKNGVDIPSVEMWLVERGRVDLVEKTLEHISKEKKEKPFYLLSDWSDPWLLAIVIEPHEEKMFSNVHWR